MSYARCAFILALTLAATALAQTWRPVPMVSADLRSRGVSPGGEGGQVLRTVVVSASDPNFVLFGTDVGGLYRSRDGGDRWQPCNVGYTPRGTSGLYVDPRNPDRILSVGSNSMATPVNGLYLSVDGACSWSPVLPAKICDNGDEHVQIAYDPASFDADKGYTAVVLWSRPARDEGPGEPEILPALYRSADGGATWTEQPDLADFGGSFLAFHPTQKGVLYAGNDRGLFKSADGGHAFRRTFAGEITGLCVSPAAPESVWVSTPDALWASADAGETFAALPSTGRETGGRRNVRLHNLAVSPADPRRMMVHSYADDWRFVDHVSHDGGATWADVAFDNRDAFLPFNVRGNRHAWHPSDPNVVYSYGGDWPTKSTDGGRTLAWHADGYNGTMIGASFGFNPASPDAVFVAFQDYNAAVTLDGGATWTYRNPSGNGWGGYCYGGLALSPRVMFCGVAPSWGGPRELAVSRDGGGTFEKLGLTFAGPDVGFADPKDENVCFASNFRSADAGKTWAAMAGCEAVFAAAADGRLFGRAGHNLVASADHGRMWTMIADIPGGFSDAAYDPQRDRFYLASEDRLKLLQGGQISDITIPKDQLGNARVASVAVDPQDPAVVYLASHRDVYATSTAALRSTDAGATWQNLTPTTPLGRDESDGVREAQWVRVHPITRAAWFSGQCYGLWRIDPPGGAAVKP